MLILLFIFAYFIELKKAKVVFGVKKKGGGGFWVTKGMFEITRYNNSGNILTQVLGKYSCITLKNV